MEHGACPLMVIGVPTFSPSEKGHPPVIATLVLLALLEVLVTPKMTDAVNTVGTVVDAADRGKSPEQEAHEAAGTKHTPTVVASSDEAHEERGDQGTNNYTAEVGKGLAEDTEDLIFSQAFSKLLKFVRLRIGEEPKVVGVEELSPACTPPPIVRRMRVTILIRVAVVNEVFANPLYGCALERCAGVSDEEVPDPLMGFEPVVSAASVEAERNGRNHQLVTEPVTNQGRYHHGWVVGEVDNKCHDRPYEADSGNYHAEDNADVVWRPGMQTCFELRQDSGEVGGKGHFVTVLMSKITV